jgi:hypothetical protein
MRPADEAMQAAHALDGLVAGAQIQMIGVAEDDLRAEVFEDVLGHGLDGAGGADRHEDRSFDRLMGQMKPAAAATFRGGLELVEGEGHLMILGAKPELS